MAMDKVQEQVMEMESNHLQRGKKYNSNIK